jgi:hypothetical protein
VKSASNASANGAAHAAANSAAAHSANAASSATGGPGRGNGGVPPGLADKGGVPSAPAQTAAPPVFAQNGGAPVGAGANVGPAANGASTSVPAQSGGVSSPIIQIGYSPSGGTGASGAPPIIVLNGPPAGGDAGPLIIPALGAESPSAFAQSTSQTPPDAGGAPSKTEVAASGPRGGSEQQQKVASALNAGLLEFSRSGSIVVKGEVLALAPSPASLATARALGFTVVEQLPLKSLGLSAVVLRAPPNMSADQAIAQLQAADPTGGYSLNPIYAESGRIETAVRPAPGPAPAPAVRAGTQLPATVGLIDTGVFVQHPALAGARLEQQGFAAGGLTPAKHGTAVASIAAGQAGPFHGVAPGSRIYVADVYGATGAGGSAAAVAEGIEWLVRKGAPVINISLVGPPNKLMEEAVEAAIRKGVIVVAAVGNDGPNSPPLYPAAYGGVLAVTGVDPNNHILFEAVRATQVSFAAPGSDIFAADGAAGFAKVRGTSFAAPIVAGQLALAHRRLDPKDADQAIQRLKREARPAATGAAFGFGIVGEDARLSLRPGLSQITTAEADSAERSKE